MSWRSVDNPPREFETVLTIHEEDLCPVPAWRVVDADGKEAWLRETEGPEDTYDGRPGKHGELYRRPTHWLPFSELPEFPLAPEPPATPQGDGR